jgi:hypothetical protein
MLASEVEIQEGRTHSSDELTAGSEGDGTSDDE